MTSLFIFIFLSMTTMDKLSKINLNGKLKKKFPLKNYGTKLCGMPMTMANPAYSFMIILTK